MHPVTCMYCLGRFGACAVDGSHGICPECARLPVDHLDEIARVHQAVRRAGGRLSPGCVVARAPFILLAPAALREVLRLGIEISTLPLVEAAVRFSAACPHYAAELALRTDPRLVPILAAVAGRAVPVPA